MHPTARRTDVIVQALGPDLLVYDQRRDAAHSLNATAAFVYVHADGTRSTEELASQLGDALSLPRELAIVEAALSELQAARLLETAVPARRTLARRDAVRLGLAAAALPMVASVAAPTPLMAQSADCRRAACASPPSGPRSPVSRRSSRTRRREALRDLLRWWRSFR